MAGQTYKRTSGVLRLQVSQTDDKIIAIINITFFRPPGTSVPGRAYILPQMFFFSPRFLRDPSTDRPETLPHGRNLAEFYTLTPKIPGALPPKKIWGQKHAKFRSILDHFRF